MRSLTKERRAVSRTGIRAVPSKKRQSAKMLPPRKPSTRRAGSRRGTSDSLLSRFSQSIQERISFERPFAMLTSGLIVAGVFYGLFVGGHVSSATNEVTTRTSQLLALAGFSIQDVTVTGRNNADKDELLAALGISRNDPVFGFDTEAARERLERVDWVKSATVTRLLPDAIRVDIVERSPYAIWQRGGSMSIVDREGRTITEDNLESFAHLPFVVGFGGARSLDDIYTLMQQSQPELLSRVRAFVRVGDRRWNLRLENGVDVKLPELGIEQALQEASLLDRGNKIFSRDIASVDLRLSDRVTVTLTPEALAMRNGAMTEVSAGLKTGQRTGVAAPNNSAVIPVSYTAGEGNT